MDSHAYLVSALVSYKHYEGTVIFLDIIIDENGNSGIKLFAHESGKVLLYNKKEDGR